MPDISANPAKNRLGKFVRVLVTVFALVWIYSMVGIENILHAVKNARLFYFLLAVTLFQISVFIRTLRWKILLQSTVPSISYGTLLMLNYSGSFFDIFLPTGFGGDIIRTIELNRTDQKTSIADHAGLVILDRFSGFVALFSICMVALPFARPFIPVQLAAWITVIAAVGLGAALLLIFNIGVNQLVTILKRFSFTQKMVEYIHRMSSITNRNLLPAWLISLVFHLVIISMHYSLSMALNNSVSMVVFFVFTPIVSLTLLLPSIQGLGINENVYEFLLSQVGAPPASGVALGLLIFAVKGITGLVGGIVYLYYTLSRKTTKE